jgi:hypothetical protein
MRTGPAPHRHDTLERILIVPRAHTAIFAARFQVEMYELFHRSRGGRLGHLIGTPTIVLGSLLALHGFTGAPWWGLALVAAIVGLGLRVDRIAAAISGALGIAMLGLVAVWAETTTGSATLVGLVLVGTGGAVQTLSHTFEDVPPPLSGAPSFVAFPEWVARTEARALLRSALLTWGVFFWLELWAAPRIWTIQLLHLLMRAGYRSALKSALDERAQEILAHPTSDWRRPRPHLTPAA